MGHITFTVKRLRAVDARACLLFPFYTVQVPNQRYDPTSFFKYPNLDNTWHGAQMSHQADNRE